MTGATFHDTRRNEDAYGDISMLRRSLSLERRKENRGALVEEEEEEEEEAESEVETVGELRATAPGTLSPSSSSSSLRSDLSSSSGGSATSQPRSASPSTLGPLLNNLKIGLRPAALRPSSPSRMQSTIQRQTPPPSPSSPLTPTHLRRPPFRPSHLRSKSSSTITTFEAAPFLSRSVSHPGPRSPYRFNPTPLAAQQMFSTPLSVQSSYTHFTTPRSRPTSPSTFVRATPSPPPSLYYDSYPDSHPATPRSRSPSISSLETIPDSPDAELEAESEPVPIKRSLSLGRQLGMNGKMDRKRWSVCGAEKRTDLNLETIWEDDMFGRQQNQGGVRILDEERMVDTVSELDE